MKTDELILYRNFKHQEIFDKVAKLYNESSSKNEVNRALATETVGELIEVASEHGFEGNLWHCFLAYILVNNENAFSISSEKRVEIGGSLNQIARHDFWIFEECFSWNLEEIDNSIGVNCFALIEGFKPANSDGAAFNRRIRDRICDLAKSLAAANDADGFLEIMREFYYDFGVGKFGLHKAFRLEKDIDGNTVVAPITRVRHVELEDLIGIDMQKQKLCENTEAFLAGRPANNVLMFGDAGTGKSSSIKGILNKYYPAGLRIIEVYKHQFQELNELISQIKNRNYKFIIYMDDLSFEDTETEYKYLKAVIEGGLEKKPDNVLIYATSNRRHLVHENFGDKLDVHRNDDLHESDTVQEKLSLSARFGVKIYFGRPGKKEFNTIVKAIAERNDIKLSEEELFAEANKWELSHGGMSGRTAEQFIDYLLGKE